MLKPLSIILLLLTSSFSYANPTKTWNACHDNASKVSEMNECDSAMTLTLRSGLDSLAERVALKVSPENELEVTKGIYRSLDSFQEYAESYCLAISDDPSPSGHMDCFALQMRIQGGLMLDLIEGKRFFKETKAAKKPIAVVMEKHSGKAIGNDEDVRRIKANIDVGELTSVLATCPLDKASEPLKQERCMNNAALVVSEWMYKSNISVGKTLINIYEGMNGVYQAYLTQQTGELFLPIVMAVESKSGRNMLIKGGYVKAETMEKIEAKMKADRQ